MGKKSLVADVPNQHLATPAIPIPVLEFYWVPLVFATSSQMMKMWLNTFFLKKKVSPPRVEVMHITW